MTTYADAAAVNGVISVSDAILRNVVEELKRMSDKIDTYSARMVSLEKKISGSECNSDHSGPEDAAGVFMGLAPDYPDDNNSARPRLRWACPVCKTQFKHRDSFKGHIRTLAKPSRRPACHLNRQDGWHQALVHRFPGEFHVQAQHFAGNYYSEVRQCCSAFDTDEQSFQHLASWINAISDVTSDAYIPKYDVSCRAIRRSLERQDSVSRSRSRSRARWQ